MSHTCHYQHIIFRTYKSEKTIPEETKSVLFAYIKKICNNQGVQVLAINSHLDHIHILIELPATLCVAETVKYIKQSSSKAFHRHKYFPFFDEEQKHCAWKCSGCRICSKESKGKK